MTKKQRDEDNLMIQKLAKAIGYPDRVPDDVDVYAFRVDGGECIAEKYRSGLVLKRYFEIPLDDLPLFAGFAAGRMLREEAVFSWDDRTDRALIWYEIRPEADAARFKQAFEDFLDSCDWWVQRIAEIHAPPSVFPDIMIRP